MPLGSCPTCHGKVSTNATSCPHCGESSFVSGRRTAHSGIIECCFCQGKRGDWRQDYVGGDRPGRPVWHNCSSCNGVGYLPVVAKKTYTETRTNTAVRTTIVFKHGCDLHIEDEKDEQNVRRVSWEAVRRTLAIVPLHVGRVGSVAEKNVQKTIEMLRRQASQ